MARPVQITFSAADADAVCLSQTTGAAGALTINGAALDKPATMNGVARAVFDAGVNRTVSLTSAANLSGVNFTITGLTADGTAVSETIAGPNATTVYTTALFNSVTSVTADAAVASAVTVGSGTTGNTRWVKLDHFQVPFNVALFAVITATLTADVEYTPDNVDGASAPTVIDHPDMSDMTATTDGNIAFPAQAVRLAVESSSGSGAVTFTVIQAGD